jgi:hypothetical protein
MGAQGKHQHHIPRIAEIAMAHESGSANRSTSFESIDQFRKMARAKAINVAHLYGLEPRHISRYCCRGDIPGAVKLGQIWYVTPAGMDKMFEGKHKR